MPPPGRVGGGAESRRASLPAARPLPNPPPRVPPPPAPSGRGRPRPKTRRVRCAHLTTGSGKKMRAKRTLRVAVFGVGRWRPSPVQGGCAGGRTGEGTGEGAGGGKVLLSPPNPQPTREGASPNTVQISLLSPLRGWGFPMALILGLTPQALCCRPFGAGPARCTPAAHDLERNPTREPASDEFSPEGATA